MLGLMQDFPLIVPRLLTYAEKFHRHTEIVSRRLEGGWFDTGDIAVINEDGSLQLTDRAKDMIKSGGEWISSIDLAQLEGRVAKWWFPDDIVAVQSLPLGTTGKVQKNELREQFKDYSLPAA